MPFHVMLLHSVARGPKAPGGDVPAQCQLQALGTSEGLWEGMVASASLRAPGLAFPMHLNVSTAPFWGGHWKKSKFCQSRNASQDVGRDAGGTARAGWWRPGVTLVSRGLAESKAGGPLLPGALCEV